MNNNINYIMTSTEEPLYTDDKGMVVCTDQDQNCAVKKHELGHIGAPNDETSNYMNENIFGINVHSDQNAPGSSDLNAQFPLETQLYVDDRPFELKDFNKSISNSSGIQLLSSESAGEKPKLELYTGDRPFPGRPFNCKYCEKSFTKNSDFKRHYMIHTGERPFVCNLCGIGFVEKSKLNVHFRHHTGERPFKCQECGKTFMTQSGMTYHRKTHSGERNFVCCDCGKTFIKRSNLTRHANLHSGERPYVCMVCGLKFRERGDLKRHMLVHTKEKNLQCDTCGKFFAKKPDLRRHIRIHTKECPYSCTVCSKSFAYTYMVKEHMKKEHNITTVPRIQGVRTSPFHTKSVIETVNSSIVAPALAFIINQKNNLEQQHSNIQAAENFDTQASGTSNYKEALKSEVPSSEVEEPEHFPELNEQDTKVDNFHTFSKIKSDVMDITDNSETNVYIKEEINSEDN